jgi:hypothetical protein
VLPEVQVVNDKNCNPITKSEPVKVTLTEEAVKVTLTEEVTAEKTGAANHLKVHASR